MGIDTTLHNNTNLATRWQRLWASLIDTLILIIITIPIMYFFGAFTITEEPNITQTILFALSSIILFMLINYKFLISNGQTVGKKLLNIKIVDLNEAVPTATNIFLRYLMYFGLGIIPVVGSLASLLSILIIFGKEKRCGHDYLAKTKVVKV